MISHHGLLQIIGGRGSAAFIVCTLQTSLGIEVSGGWVLPVGFFLSQQPSSPAGSSEDEGKPPSLDGSSCDPPDDVFLMVTQQHWENKILWEVPYNPGPPITASGMDRSGVKFKILKYCCMKLDSSMRLFQLPRSQAPSSFPLLACE